MDNRNYSLFTLHFSKCVDRTGVHCALLAESMKVGSLLFWNMLILKIGGNEWRDKFLYLTFTQRGASVVCIISKQISFIGFFPFWNHFCTVSVCFFSNVLWSIQDASRGGFGEPFGSLFGPKNGQNSTRKPASQEAGPRIVLLVGIWPEKAPTPFQNCWKCVGFSLFFEKSPSRRETPRRVRK